MANKNKVKIEICGSEYIISSDETQEYVRELANQVESNMNDMMSYNTRISTTMAAIMTALEYADIAKKATDSADNMRRQVKDYLEDAARVRLNADEARREIERLNREIQSLKLKLSEQNKDRRNTNGGYNNSNNNNSNNNYNK